MIKAVLFDMDGVLVDTEWFYNRRRVAFMEEKGFHFDEIPDLSGSNEPAIWEALVPDDIELRERLRVEYKQVYSPVHPVPYAELLNEQAEPVMRELHERGVKCAIASSSYRELIDELVEIAGIADVLGSDHAPHTKDEKARPYPASPSGMPGVQTLVPVMLDHVAAGRLSLARFVDLTSAGPARLFGIKGKGRISAGFDADFTVVDLKAERRIENAWIASKAAWTPFDGMAVQGWPVATLVRGRIAMREGEIAPVAAGRPIGFLSGYNQR